MWSRRYNTDQDCGFRGLRSFTNLMFRFVITPYTDATEGETVLHRIPNYQSGTIATIIVAKWTRARRER